MIVESIIFGLSFGFTIVAMMVPLAVTALCVIWVVDKMEKGGEEHD